MKTTTSLESLSSALSGLQAAMNAHAGEYRCDISLSIHVLRNHQGRVEWASLAETYLPSRVCQGDYASLGRELCAMENVGLRWQSVSSGPRGLASFLTRCLGWQVHPDSLSKAYYRATYAPAERLEDHEFFWQRVVSDKSDGFRDT